MFTDTINEDELKVEYYKNNMKYILTNCFYQNMYKQLLHNN